MIVCLVLGKGLRLRELSNISGVQGIRCLGRDGTLHSSKLCQPISFSFGITALLLLFLYIVFQWRTQNTNCHVPLRTLIVSLCSFEFICRIFSCSIVFIFLKTVSLLIEDHTLTLKYRKAACRPLKWNHFQIFWLFLYLFCQ